MKKILITGASGFLGGRLSKIFNDNYIILTPSHKEMDITNESSVMQYISKAAPDIIIHCAAISDTGLCQKNPELSHLVNVLGSKNIAKAAKLVSAKCIMCSSDQVYCGSQKDSANAEDDILAPHNVYGKDKAFTEQSCLRIDPDSVHLRLAWMYDSKADASFFRNDFLKQLKNCIKSKQFLTLPTNDKRGITDVWEVVTNMEKTFYLPGGIYNFGAPNKKSTYELVLSIFETLHYDTELLRPITYEKARNISMSQTKVEQYDIHFSSTEEALIHHLTNNI